MTAAARSAAGYIAPDIGFEALKDACAAIRCVAADDGEGLGAIVNGSEHPRSLVAAITVIAVTICRRGGLDDAGISALLAEFTSVSADFLLDQKQPAEGGDRPSQTGF